MQQKCGKPNCHLPSQTKKTTRSIFRIILKRIFIYINPLMMCSPLSELKPDDL